MRLIRQLVQNGNSTQISIPRNVLHYLGWVRGEAVVMELTEAKELILRRPRVDDFAPAALRVTAPPVPLEAIE